MSPFVAEVAIVKSHSNNSRNGCSLELLHFFCSLLKFLLGPTRLIPSLECGIIKLEWAYFLNKGSKNIIHGNGIIQQEILWSKLYYIVVGNLNSEEVEVQLNFTIKGFLYNTTQACYKCSLSHHLCSLKLFLLRANAAVLTSPATEQIPVKHIKGGLNPISVHQLQFNNPHASEKAKIGLIVAVVALTCLDTCANFKKPLWLVDLLHP
ncbi:E3 ubiquitin-protein ligase APD1 [Camellia lanceoleosa]|uniref:E3 ubiquitin-protein ligase APD1 n=1 Tax=Camellia lanceoleosa TaxID=1840588 RepID=A0ACC0HFB6_9ERIC|nr:E3 ubiquitin-protein ligase APD1 [Camellia lanceoleosa]